MIKIESLRQPSGRIDPSGKNAGHCSSAKSAWIPGLNDRSGICFIFLKIQCTA